jgi:hypothetical protein
MSRAIRTPAQHCPATEPHRRATPGGQTEPVPRKQTQPVPGKQRRPVPGNQRRAVPDGEASRHLVEDWSRMAQLHP